VAQELFATMRDVYVLTGDLAEDTQDCSTADGRPATKASARVRLGRMICADEVEFHHLDAARLAQAVRDQQTAAICEAMEGMLTRMQAGSELTIVLSGRGEFLARRALAAARDDRLEEPSLRPPAPAVASRWNLSTARVVSLQQQLGAPISAAAPAYAIAVLAQEQRAAGRPLLNA
jgi:hypothetical protein